MRIRLAVLLLATVVAPAAFASTVQNTAFTPAAVAGRWTGTWHNVTFGSTGSASMTVTSVPVPPKKVKYKVKVRVKGKLRTKTKTRLVAQPPKLQFVADFGGNVFGCADPPPGGTTITRGTGLNHWDANGFQISATGPTLGTTELTYDHAARTLKGGGMNPACAGGLTWTLDGAFPDANTFRGTVAISLPSGFAATSELSLTRG
jgi:hypothetical protein